LTFSICLVKYRTAGLCLSLSPSLPLDRSINSTTAARCCSHPSTRLHPTGSHTAKMPLHQYDYLFAIGTIFAALDAWNIGE
jgi:hypothetical protein